MRASSLRSATEISPPTISGAVLNGPGRIASWLSATSAERDRHRPAISNLVKLSGVIVTPLPVGPDRAWFNPPHDRLGRRFDDSRYLDLLTSQAQRDIRFSHGMMGSPAVGSLLFRLKEFDTKSSGAGTNHDGKYHELLSTHGRVAVVGSAVGGTGASVAPTLAQRFADDDDVMAVMVLNWFRFGHEGLDEATLEKAQRRNRSMVQNADSAFAYYGQDLARRVATVPVGAPDTAITSRRYTSDTQQPIRESFVHGVAALCCLHHFVDHDARSPGLYQMGAEDPTRLGGGNRLPGGAGGDTIQSLANQAATLADVLDVFARTLTRSQTGGVLRVDPCHLGGSGAPGRSGADRPGAAPAGRRVSRAPRVDEGRAGRGAAARPFVDARSPVARTAGDTPHRAVGRERYRRRGCRGA